MFKNFDEMKAKITSKGLKTIAIAAPEDEQTIAALKDLTQVVNINYILVGDEAKIVGLCEKAALATPAGSIVNAANHEDAAAMAVELVREQKADVLMKGALETSTFVKAVLNKETGIGLGGLLSHLAVIECPTYHKLLFITDGGINPAPDLDKKRAILLNTVDFMQKLGYNEPKVAALCAVEKASDKMPETLDADKLAKENKDGLIKNCYIEGPISFDIAISVESASIKGAKTELAGEVDVLLAPNISTGNVLAKSLLYLANAKMAGCVLGAKVPIVLTSRGASADEKLLSFLLTLAAS